MHNVLDLNVKIIKSGLYSKAIEYKAKCVRYTNGSLGSLYDYYSGDNVKTKNVKVKGYIKISCNDYSMHTLNLAQTSNTYTLAESLLSSSDSSDDSYIRVYSGCDSYLVRCLNNKVNDLGLVQPNPFKVLDRFKKLLKK